MTKRFLNLSLAIVGLVLIYFLGPKPNHPVYTTSWPVTPSEPYALETYIAQKESLHHLRKDNEARILWSDSMHTPTEYAILYLHGFSASHGEGAPVHERFAKSIGANLFLARLEGHGLDTTEQLGSFTAAGSWKDALEALSIAQHLGKKVIVMSTSTGSTFALKLAADYPDKVYALINMSPNLALGTSGAFLLNNHWGKQIATLIFGRKRHTPQPPGADQYWDSAYTVNALVQLEELIETTMLDETFTKISCPVLTLYYYKDEQHHDEVIDLEKIPEAHQLFSTPENQNTYIPLATPENHVLGSPLKSKDIEVVYKSMVHWWEGLEKP